MYNPVVLEHYRHPRNAGELTSATHKAEELNPLCGDEILLYIIVKDNRVKAARHQSRGCALMTAAASVLTEHLKDKTIKQSKTVNQSDLQQLLNTNIKGTRQQCLSLPLLALSRALAEKKG